MSVYRLIITCEHASASVPPTCVELLGPYLKTVEEHQIFDRGTLAIATHLAEATNAPLFTGDYTRLAIDLNRSIGHPDLFSPPLRTAPEHLRQALEASLYAPFRRAVAQRVQSWIEAGHTVLHLSVHSYTPNFFGRIREVDFGILFDPARALECDFSDKLQRAFQKAHPRLRIAFNQPYAGIEDGHTTALRARFPQGYLGIELEYSHGLDLIDPHPWVSPVIEALRG